MADAGKRGVDVFAVTQTPSVPGVEQPQCRISEGDVVDP